MTTVTISKKDYLILEKRAALYSRILKSVEKEAFPTENYSLARMKEFLREDKLSSRLRAKANRILKSASR